MADEAKDTPIGEYNIGEEIRYSTLKVIINAVAQTSAQIVANEFVRAMGSSKVKGRIDESIMPYLYAAGFLSFAGREIDSDNVKRIVKSIGIEPDERYISALMSVKIESHLIYVYAFYYLIANGKQASEDNISKVVKSLGIEPNSERIRYVLKMSSVPWRMP